MFFSYVCVDEFYFIGVVLGRGNIVVDVSVI